MQSVQLTQAQRHQAAALAIAAIAASPAYRGTPQRRVYWQHLYAMARYAVAQGMPARYVQCYGPYANR